MTILYVITRILTFFGAVLRTFWEHIACRICKIPIENVRIFKNEELCGHIEHELPQNLKQSFLVCWLPFTLNFLMGCAFLLSGSYRLFYIGGFDSLQSYGLVWLGVSCLANCAPCYEDALALKGFIFDGSNKVLKVLLAPFFAVVWASAFLEKYSVTFVFSVFFAVAFPAVFNLLFPFFEMVRQMIN